MEQLSSCYFCGVAHGEQVDPYRLGGGTTVTLCPACSRKLDTVLDTVDATTSSSDQALARDADDEDDPTDAAADPDVSTDVGGGGDAGIPGGFEPKTGAGSEEGAVDPGVAAPESDGEERSAGPGEREDVDPLAQTTVSALEYNKVMRLLQNRQFPVDRREIETVAASAYNLAESECGEVIDLAVDRGLLEEEDGQLRRSE